MRRFPSVLVLLAALGVAHAQPIDAVFSGRIPCVETEGVRFCAGDVTTRVESWDGIPLDVNLTLPPAGALPPYPLIVDEHGWSLGKSPGPFVERALAGYAVLSYSARGFHASCGTVDARLPDPSLADPDACARGWTHLADARYEIRDTQHLAGLLADEGWVIPTGIGVTGASYGGGRTIILAALRNRVMLPDGTLVPWESPGGLAMEIAAGAALIPWSDLPAALVPNGTTLDWRVDNPYGPRGGVRKDQWNDTLYGAGASTGFYAPPGVDPTADLTGWNAHVQEGEPYDADSATQALIDEFTTFHSGYYIDDSIAPAPLFIYNAWTDDLFPANEGLRYWLKASDRHPGTEFAVLFADDFGHPRANLGFGGGGLVPNRVARFFERHLQGAGDALPVFEAYTQACRGASPLGAFTADDWHALHPGVVVYEADELRVFDEAGGDPAVATALAPLLGGPCRTVPAIDDPGAATYVLPPATGDGYTLLGSPTIVADFVVTGAEYAQVAGRLWDVAPDGSQTLISHGFYRPRSDNLNPQAFQLPPNGWRFAAGHAPKLELLGQSVPAGRASAGPFTVAVTTLELRLPVHEAPDGGVIRGYPDLPTVVRGEPEPPPCPKRPAATCAPASTSSFRLARGKRAARDRIAWSWRGAGAVDPATLPFRSGATLCLWDGAERLVQSVPAGLHGACGRKPCWSATSARARYRDRRNTRTGMRALTVRAARDGGTLVESVGGGARLGTPVLPLAGTPIVVQLHTGSGACFEARYAELARNDAKQVKAALAP